MYYFQIFKVKPDWFRFRVYKDTIDNNGFVCSCGEDNMSDIRIEMQYWIDKNTAIYKETGRE
jgi:hypothetical protein